MATNLTTWLPKYAWLLPAALTVSACGDSSVNYVSAANKQQALRAVDAVATEDESDAGGKDKVGQGESKTPPDLGLPDTISLIDAKFNVVAKTGGADACKGSMKIQVNAALSKTATTQLLQVPEGGIDCNWMGKVDLAKMFGAFSAPPAKGDDPLSVANNVLALKALGDGTYNPPRPLLPSFLATARETLAQLNYTESNITIKTPSGSAKGNVTVKMNYYDKPLSVPGTNYNFKHVMDFTVTNTGFEGVDKVSNFIFDSIQFTMSTSPVAIIGIKLKGNAKGQFIAQKSKMDAITGLLKVITWIANADPTGLILAITGLIPMELNLGLIYQDDLDNQLAQADKTSAEQIGEVIGGQPTK